MESHGTHIYLLMVSLSLTTCAAPQDYPEAKHYREHKDTTSLNQTLHRYLKPGDSIEHVNRLLGSGDEGDRTTLLRVQKTFARKVPASYPDGVEDGDRFLEYDAPDNCSIILQFRDNRLINFDPGKVPDGL